MSEELDEDDVTPDMLDADDLVCVPIEMQEINERTVDGW